MHDRKILILDPDPPDKADAPSVRLREYIKSDAPHLSQEFTLRIGKLVFGFARFESTRCAKASVGNLLDCTSWPNL